MSAVLFQTLAWTGGLIALVLVLRRPVARHFGPQAAYALWALPMLRLVLPPVVRPAAVWQPAPVLPALPEASFAPALAVAQSEVAVQPGFDLVAALAAWPLDELLLAAWLGGAAVFLWRRFGAYFALRDQLLAEGREVGRVRGLIGPVRLIETPATAAPLALGVLDPVIALPPGFLALTDRAARDLALAHELAHHRALDLLVNVLVQPLFALHWWSPLARYGWLALRRDQEAACDARVMARRPAQERAAYAALIVRFAAAPGTAAASHAALTAPMACPVLGEKSIIHRLRSLAMSDMSPRRRWAGHALLGAGLLALPLTASITYAAQESERAAPEPPAAPAAPAAPKAPIAPAAPEAPEAPEAPQPPERADAVAVSEHMRRDADGNERRMNMVFRASHLEELARGREGIPAEFIAERDALLAQWRAGQAEADKAMADLPRIIAEARAEAAEARALAATQPRVVVRHECRPGSEAVSETTTEGEVQVVSICHKRIYASAVTGLEEARAEIARDRSIPDETRAGILRQLDRQIARWRAREG